MKNMNPDPDYYHLQSPTVILMRFSLDGLKEIKDISVNIQRTQTENTNF